MYSYYLLSTMIMQFSLLHEETEVTKMVRDRAGN